MAEKLMCRYQYRSIDEHLLEINLERQEKTKTKDSRNQNQNSEETSDQLRECESCNIMMPCNYVNCSWSGVIDYHSFPDGNFISLRTEFALNKLSLPIISWFLKILTCPYLGASHFECTPVFWKQFVLDTVVPYNVRVTSATKVFFAIK